MRRRARASDSARRVLDLATARYEGGVASYLDLISAQQACSMPSGSRRSCSGQRLLVSVFLVKALGGDCDRAGAGRRQPGLVDRARGFEVAGRGLSSPVMAPPMRGDRDDR